MPETIAAGFEVLMVLEITGGPDGDNEIQQGVGKSNINKHINPVIESTYDHQQDRGLGADNIDTHDPVKGSGARYGTV